MADNVEHTISSYDIGICDGDLIIDVMYLKLGSRTAENFRGFGSICVGSPYVYSPKYESAAFLQAPLCHRNPRLGHVSHCYLSHHAACQPDCKYACVRGILHIELFLPRLGKGSKSDLL